MNLDQYPLNLKQRSAITKLITSKGGIIWAKVGRGKTRMGLVAAHILLHGSGSILVVCRRAAFQDWRNEVATLQLPYDVVTAEELCAGDLPPTPRDCIILMSEGMLLNHEMHELLSTHTFTRTICAAVIDELYLFKNPQSKHHIYLREITRFCEIVIGLSGSIMTRRDLVEIYGQVAVVGRSRSLSRHLSEFRETYQIGISGDYMSWYPKPGSYAAIMERIESFTYIDMSPCDRDVDVIESTIEVEPTEEQSSAFASLKSIAQVDDRVVLKNMANVVQKAQQISNGWLKTDNGDIVQYSSNKLDRCVALVEEIVEANEKVVVWCAYREDITRLKSSLKVSPIVTMVGGKAFNLKLWQRPECQVCLAMVQSGSSINHFAQVKYGIYFSQDWKWLSLQQSQGRHTRENSLHDQAFFFYLHTRGSLDSKVFYAVRHAKGGEEAFVKQMEVQQWIKS